MTETEQLNLAFVGCGGIAKSHWNGIQTFADRINVTAAVDIDPERAAAMPG
jgi:predicted dehydrogenase